MKILFLYKYEFIEPLGIMTLAAYLKKNGHECDYIDLKLEKDPIEQIKKYSPNIIAYSITTGAHKFYQDYNLKLKEAGMQFLAIFGGPHCTFYPEFINEEGVDVICRGEGEYAFGELCDNLQNKESIKEIKNLWVKENGEIFKNDLRELITDLDSLPFPDRSLVNKYSEYKKMKRRYFMTGRGCPYGCTFCFNHAYNKLYNFKNVVRKRSVDNVIQEVEQIKDDIKFAYFQDDIFSVDSKWTQLFCEQYKEKINKPFICHVRLNLVKEQDIKALKEAGCVTVLYGIESGNEEYRKKMLKRQMSNDEIINAARIIKKYGIKSYVTNIIGFPEESLEMTFETLKLNIKAKTTYAWASLFQPYPGTELAAFCKDKGYIESDSVDMFNASYYNSTILKTDHNNELERLRNLFGVTVSLPFLFPITKILIKLPLNLVYRFVWNLHRAYMYMVKVSWISFMELIRYI